MRCGKWRADFANQYVGPFSPDQRVGPLSILQRLGLVDQIIPVHNYYFKIHLVPVVSDEVFLAQLRRFNKEQKVEIFHSLYNGQSILLVTPPALPPQIPAFHAPDVPVYDDVKVAPQLAVFVLEEPPFRLTLGTVTTWATSAGLLDVHASWRTGPSGSSCIAIICVVPYDVVPPSTITLPNGRGHRLRFFTSVSQSFLTIS